MRSEIEKTEQSGDHNPESVYGVSLHCTNGIIVQLKNENFRVIAVPLNSSANTGTQENRGIKKQRSFDPSKSGQSQFKLSSFLSTKTDQIWCWA